MTSLSDAKEFEIRSSLFNFTAEQIEPQIIIEEFWIPLSHERADVVALTAQYSHAFEIKSSRDTLSRLPRQHEAYERLFDYCSVVVARKHLAQVCEILPAWWGIFTVEETPSHPTIITVRDPSRHQNLDENTLVRLLWRNEAALLFPELVETKLHRAALWRRILEEVDLDGLRDIVRTALISRDPKNARIPNHRLIQRFDR